MRSAPVLLALALPVAALAQTAQRPPEPPPGYAGEVIVRSHPRTPPVVKATYPAQGAVVAGGTLVLKVVFDQAMSPDGWSYAKAAGADFPACLPRPRLLADERTFVLLCSTVRGRSYAVGLNADPAEGFADPSHRFAGRYDLSFSTAPDGELVRPVSEALAAAALTPADSPIESWRGQAGATGVANAPPARPDQGR